MVSSASSKATHISCNTFPTRSDRCAQLWQRSTISSHSHLFSQSSDRETLNSLTAQRPSVFSSLPDKKGHDPGARGRGKEGRVVELLDFSARASFRARAVNVLI